MLSAERAGGVRALTPESSDWGGEVARQPSGAQTIPRESRKCPRPGADVSCPSRPPSRGLPGASTSTHAHSPLLAETGRARRRAGDVGAAGSICWRHRVWAGSGGVERALQDLRLDRGDGGGPSPGGGRCGATEAARGDAATRQLLACPRPTAQHASRSK